MKVLFDCVFPFSFAHGGAQTQIEKTKSSLSSLGIETDWLRWWDDSQKGDIIHYFGRPSYHYVFLARHGGRKVVIADLLGGQGSRTAIQKLPHRLVMEVDRLLGSKMARALGWQSYRICDKAVFLTEWERQVGRELFGCPLSKSDVVPNGVEQEFFLNDERPSRGKWLVCTATITERKRVAELAEASSTAQIPVWIIGKPYADDDPYYRRFLDAVASSNGMVRYKGPVSDRSQMAEIYKTARGFVLLSTLESLSLSALEAAASGCPLLLTDLPWARSTFAGKASYCPIDSAAKTATHLKVFYDAAPDLPIPERPGRWNDVALQLKGIYEGLMDEKG